MALKVSTVLYQKWRSISNTENSFLLNQLIICSPFPLNCFSIIFENKLQYSSGCKIILNSPSRFPWEGSNHVIPVVEIPWYAKVWKTSKRWFSHRKILNHQQYPPVFLDPYSGKAMSPNTPKKGFLSFDHKNGGMLEHKFETRFSSFPPFRVFGGKKWVNNWINLYKPLNSTKPCGWHLEVVWSLGCLSWRWPCTKGFAEGVPCYENLLPRGFGSTKFWVFRVVLEDWTKLRFLWESKSTPPQMPSPPSGEARPY